MKTLIALAFLCACSPFVWGQTITITPWYPHPYALVDSNLFIQVIVSSTNPLSSVTANVNSRQTTLITLPGDDPSKRSGTLSLLGLPEDTVYVQIVATDNQNNQQTAIVPFRYDLPPSLIVEFPLSWSVASPQIRIKAKCMDKGGCTLTIGGSAPGFIVDQINSGDSIDTMLDLSANIGRTGNIDFIAKDLQGRYTIISKQVLVENSPYLKPVYEATDQILDLNYNKVLVANTWWKGSNNTPDLNPYVHRTRIIDLTTGDSIPIPYQGPLTSSNVADPRRNSYLTPYGAIFPVVDTTTNLAQIMDWNNGSLYSLGTLNSSNSIRTAGNYAIWNNNQILKLRNLQSVTNTIISSSTGNGNNDVVANGMVVYWSSDYNIYRFANNISTKLTDNAGNKWNVFPLTDGINIVYNKRDPCCTDQHYALHVHNGQTDSLLSDMGTKEPVPGYNYQLNNKYIAYTKPNSSGNYHVWLRDTSGIHSRVTFSGTDNKIDFLAANGNMTYITSLIRGRRYLTNKATGQITEIGSSLGWIYYRDSTWYWVLGRMLYKIDESLFPQNPVQPIIEDLKNIYCNNNGLQKIKILNLPNPVTGISVKVILDTTSLPVGPDSSFAFNANTLWTGQHTIQVIYSSSTGTSTFTSTFRILEVVTPAVQLTSNPSKVTNLTDPVLLIAYNRGGGGDNPEFTFASDRNFTHVLQADGGNNMLYIDPRTLNMGPNWFYVRMKTSDPCATAQTAVDRVLVVRIAKEGIVDPEFPNQVITVHPNPFNNFITIAGLNDGKSYLLTIQNSLGLIKHQQQVNRKETSTLYLSHLPDGNYWISIYDHKKHKLIGTLPVLKEGRNR
jgi:hypothetical protein